MLTRNEIIFMKVEGAYGVDSVPGVDDAIQVSALSPNPNEGARFADRKVSSGNMGTVESIFGGTLYSLTFEMEVKGGNGAGVAPELGLALRACAHTEVITPGTSVVYTPRSTNHESVSIYFYQDGKRTRLTGCRGTVAFSAAVGEVITASFSYTGRANIADPQDQAFPAVAFPNQALIPPVWLGQNNFRVDTFNPALTEFTLDPQLTLTTASNANSNDGYGEVRLTARNPTGTLDPEDVLPSTQNFIQDFINQQYKEIDLRIGAAGGSRVNFNLPRVNYRETGAGDRDGTRTVSLGYTATQTGTGNNEYSLTFD